MRVLVQRAIVANERVTHESAWVEWPDPVRLPVAGDLVHLDIADAEWADRGQHNFIEGHVEGTYIVREIEDGHIAWSVELALR